MPRLRRKEEDPKVLGTSQAASYLKVHRSTLNSWRRRGEIEASVVEETPRGPRYRYHVKDLKDFRERIIYDEAQEVRMADWDSEECPL